MLCAGLDAERADDAHLLAERNGERGVGCAAPDQQRRRIVQRIGVGKDGASIVARIIEPAKHGRMQCPHPEGRVGARRQAREGLVGAVERQGVRRRRGKLADDDQRHVRLGLLDAFRKLVQLIGATI